MDKTTLQQFNIEIEYVNNIINQIVQSLSVSDYDSMDCSMPNFSVLLYLLECAQSHVHQVSDAIRPSHPLSPASPHALNLSQHHSPLQ